MTPSTIIPDKQNKGSYGLCYTYSYPETEFELDEDLVKNFLISSQISLLEAELERLEKQSAEIKIDWKDLSSPELIAEKSEKYGYNTALQDQITYLQEQITEIKKLL